MFRATSSSSSGGLRRNCIYAASGIVTLCRFFVVKSFVFIIQVAIFSVQIFYTLQPITFTFKCLSYRCTPDKLSNLKHMLLACKHFLIITLLDCMYKKSSPSSLLLKLHYSPRPMTFDRISLPRLLLKCSNNQSNTTL